MLVQMNDFCFLHHKFYPFPFYQVLVSYRGALPLLRTWTQNYKDPFLSWISLQLNMRKHLVLYLKNIAGHNYNKNLYGNFYMSVAFYPLITFIRLQCPLSSQYISYLFVNKYIMMKETIHLDFLISPFSDRKLLVSHHNRVWLQWKTSNYKRW